MTDRNAHFYDGWTPGRVAKDIGSGFMGFSNATREMGEESLRSMGRLGRAAGFEAVNAVTHMPGTVSDRHKIGPFVDPYYQDGKYNYNQAGMDLLGVVGGNVMGRGLGALRNKMLDRLSSKASEAAAGAVGNIGVRPLFEPKTPGGPTKPDIIRHGDPRYYPDNGTAPKDIIDRGTGDLLPPSKRNAPRALDMPDGGLKGQPKKPPTPTLVKEPPSTKLPGDRWMNPGEIIETPIPPSKYPPYTPGKLTKTPKPVPKQAPPAVEPAPAPKPAPAPPKPAPPAKRSGGGSTSSSGLPASSYTAVPADVSMKPGLINAVSTPYTSGTTGIGTLTSTQLANAAKEAATTAANVITGTETKLNPNTATKPNLEPNSETKTTTNLLDETPKTNPPANAAAGMQWAHIPRTF